MLRWTVTILITLVVVISTGGDRAAWRSIPAIASTLQNDDHMRLVIDAFMQVKGVAPGSPGFPWSRVVFVVSEGDFSSAPGQEVAIGGTILPEDGFVVLYGREGAVYKLQARYDGLARVDTLRAVRVAAPGAPGGPEDLAVTHSYDEMLGAFFRWQRLLYLRDIQGELQLLIELVTLDEAYSVAPPYAQKARLDEEVMSEKPGRLDTHWEVRHWDRLANGDYGIVASREGTSQFQWDSETNRLVQIPGSKRP